MSYIDAELNDNENNTLYPITREKNVYDSNNMPLNTKIGQLSNPNLLLNSDFSVNQRGISSMTGTNQGYMADRWRKGAVDADVSINGRDCTILINNGSLGVVVGQTIEQSNLAGKKVTASINITNSNITTAYGTNLQLTYYNGTTYISTSSIGLKNKTGIFSITDTVPENTTRIRLSISATNNSLANETITFDSPKIEIGEIATPFSPRPYAEELAMCQRYYQLKSINYTFETSQLDRTPPMRVSGTTGTLTISGTTYNYCDAEIY